MNLDEHQLREALAKANGALNEAHFALAGLSAQMDVLQRGHDRYEFLRRCSLRQLTQIWEAAMRGDTQFDAEVDRLRALPDREDGRA